MPTSDTWARQSQMDSIASVSIAASHDKIASSNSVFNDEHLDYLSEAERECLMFLEETIDSLDTEENTGISTDELEQTEQSTKIGNMLEKSTMPDHELAYSQNAVEPDGKVPRAVSPNNSNSSSESTSPQIVRAKSGTLQIPRAVSPNSHKQRIDSTSPQMARAKTGANTLPKYSPKLSAESKSTLSSRVSEFNRSPILSEDTRQSSHAALFQHQLVEPKDEKARPGPPTAPKPRKLPSNIILRNFQKNDGPTVLSTSFQNKAPKGAPRSNGYNLSRDSSTEEDPQQIRMEALAKLGLRSEPNGQKSNAAISQMESVPNSQGVTVDNEIKINQLDVMEQDTKTNHLKHPTIITGPPLNHTAAVSVDPGMNATANKPAHVFTMNMNKPQWHLGSTKSSSLKRFTTPNTEVPPAVRIGSAQNVSGTPALNPGMNNTLPIARRTTNVNEGQAKNMNPAQWQLGATKTSSLKRFSTASDNNQPILYSRTAPTAATVAPGLNKYNKPRPVSICSEKDLSDRHGATIEVKSPDKPGKKHFPVTINISTKFQKTPPKGFNVQAAPQGPTSKDHREALRKLGLLKE